MVSQLGEFGLKQRYGNGVELGANKQESNKRTANREAKSVARYGNGNAGICCGGKEMKMECSAEIKDMGMGLKHTA